MNTSRDVKKLMIQTLYNMSDYIKQVDGVEYRVRCPYCGDSQKNLNTGHLYIRIDPEDNYPMMYNCFRCGQHGIVDEDFLATMGIYDTDLKSGVSYVNKTSDKKLINKYMGDDQILHFDFKIPPISRGKKIAYIEQRLGVSLTDQDLNNMKVIPSLKDFLLLNDIHYVTMPSYITQRLEDHYVGFLSYGSTYILFRDISGNEKYRWIKYPIIKESRRSRVFYTMTSTLDLFTKETITINMAEGVMDILSAYKNLGYDHKNTINIAVCGKQYLTIINLMVSMGLVGNNVVVNIFSDNDERFNNKNNKPTTIQYFKKILAREKYIFKAINIYYNEIDKDIGVPKDKIILKHYKI